MRRYIGLWINDEAHLVDLQPKKEHEFPGGAVGMTTEGLVWIDMPGAEETQIFSDGMVVESPEGSAINCVRASERLNWFKCKPRALEQLNAQQRWTNNQTDPARLAGLFLDKNTQFRYPKHITQ